MVLIASDLLLVAVILAVIGVLSLGGALLAVHIDRKRKVARIREML